MGISQGGGLSASDLERVSIFIDGSNILHALAETKARIDYTRLYELLRAGRRCVRPNYYCSFVLGRQSEVDFHTYLRSIGYNVKQYALRKKSVRTADGKVEERFAEKGVDVGLAIDMLAYAHKDFYDTAILVSGDKDFKELVERVKSEFNKRVEIAAFESRISKEFKLAADRFISLDQLLPQMLKS